MNLEQTVFRRKKDGVLFYLIFAENLRSQKNKACFRTSDGIDEHYEMDEVMRNRQEFEMIAGNQEINHTYTAKRGIAVVLVNNSGQLIRLPIVEEGKMFRLKSTNKLHKIYSIGSWDDDANSYRVSYGDTVGFDSDFEPKV